MSGPSSDAARIQQIFFPYALGELKRVQENPFQLAYYTTAETAYHILNNHEIWMRNTMTMNDYMEVGHGIECLKEVYLSESGNALSGALDSCFPGLGNETRKYFHLHVPVIQRDTFVTCFSEHLPNEDKHGRLSMWRAYGGSSGIALVMNGETMLQNSNALEVYLSPVAYMGAPEVEVQLKKISEAILKEREFVCCLGRERLKNIIFQILWFAAICVKHPGFKEEREWRAATSPIMFPSDLLPSHVELISGMPQTVLKIKLRNNPEHGLKLDLSTLLNRIIIGPCEYPYIVSRALHQILKDAGIEKPDEKIVVSDIPLRTG